MRIANRQCMWIKKTDRNDKLRLVVETTSNYKKSGIYSAERDDISKPVVIDWGDGTVENVNGDISQKVHTYSTVGTFNVVIENIKSYAASTVAVNPFTWQNTTSQNNYTLKEVIAMPDNMTSINDYAFSKLKGINNIIIGKNISNIGNSAFSNCQSLEFITIPSSVINIGQDSFSKLMRQFTDVIFEGKTIAQVQAMSNYAFGFQESELGNSHNITVTCSDGSFILTTSCFLKGTDILLADGTTKKIEDLTYDDVLKVWDFDEGQLGSAKVCWLTRPGLKSNHYYQLTFDNGTVLKTTGINSNHRIFSVDQSKFTNVADAKVGDKVFSIDGTLTITDVKYVEEECEYYNVMTSGKINCFANGILTSDRYGNLYPIQNMKYVKDDREIKPYSLYEAVGIDRYWYDNLRLGENTETVEKSKEYVWKCIGQMLPLPDNQN